MLKNPDDLVKGGDALPLAAINDATPEGKQLLASARQILANLGKKDATGHLARRRFRRQQDLRQHHLQRRRHHHPRIRRPTMPPRRSSPTSSPAWARCRTAPASRALTRPRPMRSLPSAPPFDAWMKQAEADAATILPAGDGTAAASAAVKAIKAKVDDYFGRCRLAAFDPRTVALLNRKEEEYLAIAAQGSEH